MSLQGSSAYQGITAELYDLWFNEKIISKDFAFYEKHIRNNGGLALEIGSGSGRLLLPYLQKGLRVYGVEPSDDMVTKCKEKASQLSLDPMIYEQFMEQLNIPLLFKTIYIPLYAFQLLITETDVMGALQRFYLHLEPEGELLISLFVPNVAPMSQGVWRVVRTVKRPEDQALIILSESSYSNRYEQIHTKLIRYEICLHERCVETYIKSTQSRWYHPGTIRTMLEKIGFNDISFYGDYSNVPAGDGHESLVVSARK